MSFLSFDVDTNGLTAIKTEIANSASAAEHAIAIQVAKDTSTFVPALTGDLDRRTRVDGNLVIYPGPQSRMLYYGKLMIDPDTGSAWAKKGSTKVTTDKNLVFNKTYHSEAQSHWFEASKAQNLDKWIRAAGKAMKNDGK